MRMAPDAPLTQAGLQRLGCVKLPLTTKTTIFVGFCCTALDKEDGQPTAKMVLVVEGSTLTEHST